MIGAMYLNVTVQALFAEHALVSAFRQYPCPAVHPTGVESDKVALLAQVGLSADQQVLVIRAMRRMAVGTVFLYRRVFPQKGPALFRMAVIALLVNRVADQVSRTGPAVWLVAVGARHQAHVR